MNLKTYLEPLSIPERAEFAARAGTSPLYVYMLATGRKRPGPKICKALRDASSGAVTLAELRPDLWGEQ